MIRRTRDVREVFSNYILIFYLFCILGWLYEVTLAFIYGHGLINRGFLFGPYLPLYGFGTILIMFSLSRLVSSQIKIGNILVTPILVFFATVLLTTTLEYIVGLLLELITKQRFWDYHTYRYHFQGRICLSASIRFGLGGMLILYVLVPGVTKLINQLNDDYKFIFASFILASVVLDFILTIYISSTHGFSPVLAMPR